MTKHFSTLEHDVRLPYQFALGPAFYKWFEGLKEEKIWGAKCPRCSKVLVPARTFCPGCNVDMDEWVEVAQEGEIVSWVRANRAFYGAPVEPPFIAALIRLDGAGCNFLHLVGGLNRSDGEAVKAKVQRDARVKAVWADEKKGHMLDLKYFQPV